MQVAIKAATVVVRAIGADMPNKLHTRRSSLEEPLTSAVKETCKVQQDCSMC